MTFNDRNDYLSGTSIPGLVNALFSITTPFDCLEMQKCIIFLPDVLVMLCQDLGRILDVLFLDGSDYC